MDGTQPSNALASISLQTLVSVLQNGVQAQNSIATAINKLTAAFLVAYPPPLTSTASWTPGTVTTGSSVSISIPVTGAAFGQFAVAALGESLQDCTISANVSAAGQVTVTIDNNTGASVTFGATTVNVKVTN